jgi:hypothetical protein
MRSEVDEVPADCLHRAGYEIDYPDTEQWRIVAGDGAAQDQPPCRVGEESGAAALAEGDVAADLGLDANLRRYAAPCPSLISTPARFPTAHVAVSRLIVYHRYGRCERGQSTPGNIR